MSGNSEISVEIHRTTTVSCVHPHRIHTTETRSNHEKWNDRTHAPSMTMLNFNSRSNIKAIWMRYVFGCNLDGFACV